MTAHDTLTAETAQMNNRIARLENDRACRTRELLRVEQEVVSLRQDLHKAHTAMHYQEQIITQLRDELRHYKGDEDEDLGATQELSRHVGGSPDGLPGEGQGAEPDEDTGRLLRGDSHEGPGARHADHRGPVRS